jgi:hypothetical protein
MNTRTSKSIAAALTTGVALASFAMATPANASAGDKIRSGSCTRSTDYKLKVGRDNGRLEVEGEVDSNRRGQAWRWSMRHNGSYSAGGTKVTRGRSGSFEVRRLMVNRRGVDTIKFRARNPRTGEVCSGTVRF